MVESEASKALNKEAESQRDVSSGHSCPKISAPIAQYLTTNPHMASRPPPGKPSNGSVAEFCIAREATLVVSGKGHCLKSLSSITYTEA